MRSGTLQLLFRVPLAGGGMALHRQRMRSVLMALMSFGIAAVAQAQGAGSFKEKPGSVRPYKPGFRIYYGLGEMDGIPSAKPEVSEYANHASVPSDGDREAMLAYALDVAQGNEPLTAQLRVLDLMSERMNAARQADLAGAKVWDEVRADPAAAQLLVGKARWGEAPAVEELRRRLQAMTGTPYGELATQFSNAWRRLANDLMQAGPGQPGGSAVHAILMSTSVPEAQRRLAASRRYDSIRQAEEMKAKAIRDMIQMRYTKELPRPVCRKVYFNNEDGTPDTSRTYQACI